MEPQARALVDADQEAQTQQPIRTTQNWLAMAGPVIRQSVKRVKKVSLHGVRSLLTYFPRTGEG